MKEIQLTQGKIAIVDDDDYEELRKYNWLAHKGKRGNYYAIRNVSKKTSKNHKMVLMHRQILNPEEGMLADHKNGDGLDNRRENLRVVTYSQNSFNKKRIYLNKTSKYKGVSWFKPMNCWRVVLAKNRKQITIGYFYDEKKGALAYDEAAKKHFGEYAATNF